MKGIALTIRGFEDICAKEIGEIIKAKTSSKDSLVFFDVKDPYDFCKLCYCSQSIAKTGPLAIEVKSSSIEVIKKAIEVMDFGDYSKKDLIFAVKSVLIENEEDSNFLSAEVGAAIVDSLKARKMKYKVNLEEPETIFLAILTKDSFYLMVDFAGFDLSKRYYKLFQSPFALKGNLSYCLFRLSESKPEDSFLDFFSGTGTVSIEAAIYYSKTPVHFYKKDYFQFRKMPQIDNKKAEKILEEADNKKDTKIKVDINCVDPQFHNISSAKKNAKAAGVEKLINFSRMQTDWIDTKFGKEKISRLITYLPSPSKLKSAGEMQKLYKEFFYQIEYILTDDSRSVVVLDKDELFLKVLESEKFKVIENREVFAGEKSMKVVVIEKDMEKIRASKK